VAFAVYDILAIVNTIGVQSVLMVFAHMAILCTVACFTASALCIWILSVLFLLSFNIMFTQELMVRAISCRFFCRFIWQFLIRIYRCIFFTLSILNYSLTLFVTVAIEIMYLLTYLFISPSEDNVISSIMITIIVLINVTIITVCIFVLLDLLQCHIGYGFHAAGIWYMHVSCAVDQCSSLHL